MALTCHCNGVAKKAYNFGAQFKLKFLTSNGDFIGVGIAQLLMFTPSVSDYSFRVYRHLYWIVLLLHNMQYMYVTHYFT